MRDFPVFATQNGVGSLILKEIPYRQCAYIHIRSASEPDLFLQECLDFCRVAGAQRIFATGHALLKAYPEYTAVWNMQISRQSIPQTDAALFPVTEQTSHSWQMIYNEKMLHVPNSAYMTRKDVQDLCEKGGGYFVHKQGRLIGLGVVTGNCLDAVIATEKGAGEQVVCALSNCITDDLVVLKVASTNQKAVRLYDRMGFVKTGELSQWYQIQ